MSLLIRNREQDDTLPENFPVLGERKGFWSEQIPLSWRRGIVRILDRLRYRLAPAQQLLIEMSYGYRVSQLVYVAAKLGLADLLHSGPQPVEELAKHTGTNPLALYRLLRALAGVGIFAEDRKAPGWFSQTSLSALLNSQLPGSIRDSAIMNGEDWNWRPWGELLYSVKTGEVASNYLFGKSRFAFLAEQSEARAIFDAAMSAASERVAHLVAEYYDFSNVKTLIDVGGGQGTLLMTILKKHPHLQGILFDLPEVISQRSTTSAVSSNGLEERCKPVSGDFFAGIPEGAELFILKSVIHNWEDEQAVAILKNCHNALPQHGKVLLVEWNIAPGNGNSFGKLVDVQLMVSTGGRVRTQAEYADLYQKAGFELSRVIELPDGGMTIIEGRPSAAG